MYMEDADIAESPLGSTEFSLFGVFDGHGGILYFIVRSRSFSFREKTLHRGTFSKSAF